MPTAGRPPKPSPTVFAGYVAYMAVGWYLAGLGSVLPDLEDELGAVSAVYPLLPGAVLLVWGLTRARRQRHATRDADPATTVSRSSLALAVAVVGMGVTAWPLFGVTSAIVAAVAAAALIRLLPATFAVARPDDTEVVMVRANAWSSLASISSPLVIGLSIGVGIGWLPGLAGPIVLGGIVAAAAIGVDRTRADRPKDDTNGGPVPPWREWGRAWSVVTVGIVVEFCFAYYAATFLHEEVGMSTAAAAAGVGAWGGGMTVGRFALSVRTPPRSIAPTVTLVSVGFVLLWAVATPFWAIVGIGLAGLGVAPLYPTRVTVLMARFPHSADQGSTRGAIASGTALLVAPALMAALRAATDVRTAYLAVPVLLIGLAILDRRRADTSDEENSGPGIPPVRLPRTAA